MYIDVKICCLILTFYCALAIAAPPSVTKVYRSDYTYNKQTDAFYKLHTEARTTFMARKKCETEGAKLMVALPQDIKQLHAMFKRFPDLGEYVLVEWDRQDHDLVGSSKEEPMIECRNGTFPSQKSTSFLKKKTTLKEKPETNSNMESEPGADPPTCEVVTRSGEIESAECSRKAPFICKVDAANAPYDEQCGVYGTNYIQRIPTVGSCYKIPIIVYSWNEAYAECEAEGAHLVVLNSEGEHEVVKDIMNTAAAVPGSKTTYFFFAGIRANHPKDGTPRVFRTIYNQTLEQAGYSQWSENEPNNFDNSEYCGSLFKNDGKYNDLDCSHVYAFICENERQMV